MKHQFPKYNVYCNEVHTLKQAKEFALMAKLVGLKVDKATLRDLVNKNYPYFCWYFGEGLITQHTGAIGYEDDAFIVSFEEFKKFLGPIPSIRVEIEKLFSTI